jgi:threonine/homoserine/homoserine lactone efflux protein
MMSTMMFPPNFTSFVIASAIIIVIPGPSVLFAVARGIAWGRMTAVLTTLGNTCGTYLLAILVALGLGPIIAHSALTSTLLQLCGGAYLVYLGAEAFVHRKTHVENLVTPEKGRPTALRAVRQGFVVGALNPKSLVFYTAVFPHFVDRQRGHLVIQLLTLATTFALMAFVSDGTWGFAAGLARRWLSANPRRLIVMRAVGACVMAALGLAIVVTALGNN